MKSRFLIFFLFPLQLLAQDIAGVWVGYLQTDGSKVVYELVISEEKRGLAGYAMTVFTFEGKENMGLKTIKLKNKGGNISIEDGELVYNNYTIPPKRSKLSGQLFVSGKDSNMIMNGTFSTRSLDQRDKTSYEGIIQLKRQRFVAQTKVLPKLEELNLLSSLSFVKNNENKKDVAVVSKPVTKKNEKQNIQNPTLSRPATNKEQQKSNADEVVAIAPKTQPLNQAKKDVVIQSRPVREDELDENGDLIVAKPLRKQDAKKNNENKPKRFSDSLSTPSVAKQTTSIEVKEQTNKVSPGMVSVKPKTAVLSAPAASFALRKTEIIKNLFFKSDSLVLSLYDNGTIDGDTVSVVLNGKVIIAKQGLSEKVIRETIYITPQMGDSLQLVMYAENLGAVPPNTGLLIIQDGSQREEIRFAGDLQKSSGIVLRRKR
jgi:hypothetical protein